MVDGRMLRAILVAAVAFALIQNSQAITGNVVTLTVGLSFPQGLAISSAGSLYATDLYTVSQVDTASGSIYRVAGSGNATIKGVRSCFIQNSK